MEPGSIVGDKYRVGRPIGRGGMGVIVEATHVQLGTHVAIKILRANPSDNPEVAERFLREARAAAQLKGEHICRVHDFGTLPDGSPFMVMELLEGQDLGSLVDLEGPLAPELVAHYVIQACAGIAEAHARGLVHRDLKPGNLFLELRPDGAPFIKILDFGIAKHERAGFKLTETRSVVGSPAYMAPEQLRSSKLVDARTDIWGLGVVMYELLTETVPFTGDSMPELVLAITAEPPPPLPGDKIPAGLIDIVYRCLDKDPAGRFQSVAELAEALAPYANLDRKQLAEMASAMVAPRPRAATRAQHVIDELLAKETTLRAATGTISDAPSVRSPRGVALAAAAVVVVAALGVGSWIALRGGGAALEPAAPGTAAPSGTVSASAPAAGGVTASAGSASGPNGSAASGPNGPAAPAGSGAAVGAPMLDAGVPSAELGSGAASPTSDSGAEGAGSSAGGAGSADGAGSAGGAGSADAADAAIDARGVPTPAIARDPRAATGAQGSAADGGSRPATSKKKKPPRRRPTTRPPAGQPDLGESRY